MEGELHQTTSDVLKLEYGFQTPTDNRLECSDIDELNARGFIGMSLRERERESDIFVCFVGGTLA